ncbi:MAG: cell division protein ZapA [Bacteroidales bacterium]|jgi:cell division protein ZapA|nr:cell division protein ZapA [Bacteroidales bacterium]
MSWSQTINVKIAERFYPLKIDKEEEEEQIRKAAQLINDRLLRYQKKQFGDKDVQDFLAIVALQFAVRLIQLEKNPELDEQSDKLKQLSEQLERLLGRCTDE